MAFRSFRPDEDKVGTFSSLSYIYIPDRSSPYLMFPGARVNIHELKPSVSTHNHQVSVCDGARLFLKPEQSEALFMPSSLSLTFPLQLSTVLLASSSPSPSLDHHQEATEETGSGGSISVLLIHSLASRTLSGSR